MDSFELNKIVGALLGALLFVMGTGILSEIIFTPRRAGDAGYPLPAAQEESGGAATQQAAAQDEPLAALMAHADAAKGQNAARKCAACHSFDKGGPNKVGPNLWNVVDRVRASHEGFNYSAAMKAKGGEWSFDEINKFITNPKGYVQGTIMAFAGVPSGQERADILAYLRTLSDNPKPLPTQ